MINISDIWKKIKDGAIQDAAMPLLVILVGFGSFGLGRMSVLEAVKPSITITQTAALESAQIKGNIVASKTGLKYHFPWCAGAGQINEKNKIWFDSEEKARASGYTPAGNCKGLK